MHALPSHVSFDKAETQALGRGPDHIAPDCASQNSRLADIAARILADATSRVAP